MNIFVKDTRQMENIYKKQDLIFSKMPNDITELELKLINVLYKVVQNSVLRNKEMPSGDKWFKVELSYLRENMALSFDSNYNTLIKTAIRKIADRSIELHNFVHPANGKVYDWFLVKIIKDSNIEKKYKNFINIQFSELFIITCWRKVKYTTLDINVVNSFKSKYSIRLYEVLKTFSKFRTEVDMNLEFLNTIFLKKENKYLSKIVDILERHKVAEEVFKKLPFKYEAYKKDKKIAFFFYKDV